MNRKDLSEILDEAVEASQAKYCDGGLRYQLNQASAFADMLEQSIKTHKLLGTRGYAIKKLSPVSEQELKETLLGFVKKPLGSKAEIITQKLINAINASNSPYAAQIWEADYEGYGLVLVVSIVSDKGNLVLAMDWAID